MAGVEANEVVSELASEQDHEPIRATTIRSAQDNSVEPQEADSDRRHTPDGHPL